MSKRGFNLVIFLSFLLLIIPLSFAQTAGCCVDLSGQTEDVCTQNVQSSSCQGTDKTFYPGIECTNPETGLSIVPTGECEEGCKVCGPSGSASGELIWGYPSQGCPPYDTYVISKIKHDIALEDCFGSTTITPAPQPASVTGTIVNGGGSSVNVWCSGGTGNSISTTGTSFTLQNCYTGNQVIQASATGKYGKYPLTGTVNLVSGSNGPFAINLVSQLPKDITITVKDDKTEPEQTLTTGVKVKSSSVASGSNEDSSSPFIFNVNPTTLSVTAEKPGYQKRSVNVDFSTANSATIKINKTSMVVFTGTIKNPNNNAITDAIITLYSGSESDANLFNESHSPANSNTYSVNVPNETFVMVVQKIGYVPFRETINQPANGFPKTNTKNIILSPVTGSSAKSLVNVTVVDSETGSPISAATIYIGNVERGQTNSEGKIQYDLNTGQQYLFSAAQTDYHSGTPELITVEKAMTYEIILTKIPEITVRGHVADKSGNSISNAEIKTSSIDGSSSTTTNMFGDFSFIIKAPSSSVKIYASKTGFIDQERTIPGGLQDNTIYNVVPDFALESSACTSEGNLGDISLTAAVIEGNTIKLNWYANCPPLKNEFNLYGAKEGEELSYKATVTEEQLPFEEKNLKEQTTYCYKTTALYNINAQTVAKESPVVCARIGKEECFDTSRAFCGISEDGFSDARYKCINRTDSELVENCAQESSCIELSSSETRCLMSDKCDWCNRPFGVFSNERGSGIFGAKFKFNLTTYPCAASSLMVACYSDYSKTVVDKYQKCDEIETCYDYASPDACEAHKCNPDLSCDWVSSKYSELGVGVCKPTSGCSPEEDCKIDCNEFQNALIRPGRLRSYISNKVFGSEKGLNVGRELCLLYGNEQNPCYFKSTTNQCLNKNEVSCYDYESKQECTGTDDINVDVDVQWNPDSSKGTPDTPIYVKSSGSNEVTQNSTDIMKIGLCKYTDDRCAKDADNNEGKGLNVEGGTNDCANPNTNRNCALDTIAPTTNVQYSNFVKDVNLPYSVTSDAIRTWSKALPTVVAAPGPLIYPRNPASGGVINEANVDDPPQNIPGTPYTLFYFSEDESHNLEPVKTATFILDRKKPTIRFKYTLELDQSQNTVIFTPTLNLTENDEEAYCINGTEIGLLDENGNKLLDPDSSTLSNIPDDYWSETYTVNTGANGINVKYVWKCYDRAGNFAENSIWEGTLDANGLIADPSKIVSPTTTNIPIIITTQFDGECRFINIENKAQPYDQWTAFDLPEEDSTSGRFVHSGTTSVQNAEYASFAVKCKFPDIGNVVIDGNDPADVIKITIDNKKPSTQPYTVKNNVEQEFNFKPVQWVNGQTTFLKCVDQIQTRAGYASVSKDCSKVTHCIVPTTSDCNSCTWIEDNRAHPGIEGTSKLCYYSTDLVGNEEEGKLRSQILRFDNTAPILNLAAPLNSEFYETKDTMVVLAGTISNGNGDISPVEKLWYVITNDGGTQLNNRTIDTFDSLPVSTRQAATITIPELGTSVFLTPNMINKVYIKVRDEAGNENFHYTKIIVDSSGPNLTNARINGIRIRELTSQTYPSPEFGQDYEVMIDELQDNYPGSTDTNTLKSRVAQVWLKDMFGAKYDLTLEDGVWKTTVKTRSWPVTTPNFKTFFTIYAVDILGKISEKKIEVIVRDRKDPSAVYHLENAYGNRVTKLIKGFNYIILDADEPLNDNINMYFNVSSTKKNYTVSFIARDFDARTWIGIVDIGSIGGEARVKGKMYDLNGRSSSLFTPDSVLVNSLDMVMPEPVGNKINNVYYVNSRNVQYAPIDSNNIYLFNINDKKQSTPDSNGAVSGFNDYSNSVSIRVQGDEENYKQFQETVFVDTSKPIITSYPYGTYASSNILSVIFVKPALSATSSGLNNTNTRLTIVNGTDGVFRGTLDGNSLKFPVLANGNYSVSAVVADNAGNQDVKLFKIRINSSGPAATLTGDVTPINGEYVTKINPSLSVNFILRPPTEAPTILVNDVSQSITQSGNNYAFSPSLNEGINTIKVEVGAEFWFFKVIKDSTSPVISLLLDQYASSKPLRVLASISNPETYPLIGKLIVDGTEQLSLVNMYPWDNVYSFVKDLELTGTHSITVKLTDVMGNEGTATQSATFDNLPPQEIKITALPGNTENLTGIVTSNKQEISLVGTSSDESGIQDIYAIGMDGNKYPGTFTGTTFTIPLVKLVGRNYTEVKNDIKVVAKDNAGNIVQKTIKIVKDLKPPELVELIFIKEFI